MIIYKEEMIEKWSKIVFVFVFKIEAKCKAIIQIK